MRAGRGSRPARTPADESLQPLPADVIKTIYGYDAAVIWKGAPTSA